MTGTVVRGEELLPVARARVSLAAAQRSGASSAGEAFGGFMEDRIQEIATNTSRDGAFVLTDLPAGTLTIEATHQQFRPGRVQVTLEPGQEVTVQIVLREGFDLSGTILDYLGNPEIERAVLVEGADNVQKVTRTSGDGTWSVSGLVAGTYRVWCPGPDLAEELPPRQVEVNSDISGVTITLPPPRDVAPPGEVPADPFPQSPPEVPDDLLDAWRGGGVPAGGTR